MSRGKNWNPQKSVGLPTKPKEIPGPKIKQPKNAMPNFGACNNFQKAWKEKWMFQGTSHFKPMSQKWEQSRIHHNKREYSSDDIKSQAINAIIYKWDINELKCCLHPGTLQTIVQLFIMRFIKQILCNAFKIFLAGRQVCLYLICRTTLEDIYMGTTMGLQIVLNTPKNPYVNQATQKDPYQIFLPKKNPGSKF